LKCQVKNRANCAEGGRNYEKSAGTGRIIALVSRDFTLFAQGIFASSSFTYGLSIRLFWAVKLGKLDRLDKLVKLDRMGKIDKLDKLARMVKLANLDKLAKTDRLDKLAILARLGQRPKTKSLLAKTKAKTKLNIIQKPKPKGCYYYVIFTLHDALGARKQSTLVLDTSVFLVLYFMLFYRLFTVFL